MAAINGPFGGGNASYPYKPELGGGHASRRVEPHLQGAHMSGQAAHFGAAQGYQARVHHDPVQTATAPTSAFGNITQWAGALVSLALLLGILVWGYQLIMRDVSGIPVVRATGEPMRVAPENPGGRPADHQGLAVNEVAGRGTAAGPVDQLILAPTPVDLSAEDVVTARGATPLSQPTTRTRTASQDAAIQALADQIANGAVPLEPISPAPRETPAPDVTATLAPAADAAVSLRTPRPRARPSALSVAASTAPVASAVAAAAPATDGLDLDPAAVPTGTRLVQLGAYDSADVARTEWGRIAGRFDGFFDGKRRVIQRAQSGGRTFYRLRAEGFDDLADARRFCAALVAERADCIPVVTR